MPDEREVLLPTPSTSDAKTAGDVQKRIEGGHQINLADQVVSYLASPTASDRFGAGRSPNREGGDNLRTQIANLTEGDATFPTPQARDWKGGMSNQFDVNDAVREISMMPTPTASDGSGGGVSPDQELSGRGETKLRDFAKFLPTPQARDSSTHGPAAMDRQLERGYGNDLPDVVVHRLPTPQAGDGNGGKTSHPDQRRANNHALNLPEVAKHELQEDDMTEPAVPAPRWGKYEAAIRRWEGITRPAPNPTEPNTKGNPRLAAAFSEWMMGFPSGHITEIDGITRSNQLKIIGNGVVPQQAASALRQLLGIYVDEYEKVQTLPTPVVNDMGDDKSVEWWDKWTAEKAAQHGNGNGHGKSLAIEVQRETLLPTPMAQQSGATPEEHIANKPPGRTQVTDLAVLVSDESLMDSGGKYLPTPTTQDGANNGGPAQYERNSLPLNAVAPTLDEKFLPTPRTTDYQGKNSPGEWSRHSPSLDAVHHHFPDDAKLLPTPTVADSAGGHSSRSGARKDERLLAGIAKDYDEGKLLPTPLSGDGTHGSPNQHDSSGNPSLPSAVLQQVPTLPTPSAVDQHIGFKDSPSCQDGSHQTHLPTAVARVYHEEAKDKLMAQIITQIGVVKEALNGMTDEQTEILIQNNTDLLLAVVDLLDLYSELPAS